MQIDSIDPVYYCVDQGTGVALIRFEDHPGNGVLVDFMKGDGVIRPGAVVPVHWRQLWDYKHKLTEVPGFSAGRNSWSGSRPGPRVNRTSWLSGSATSGCRVMTWRMPL